MSGSQLQLHVRNKHTPPPPAARACTGTGLHGRAARQIPVKQQLVGGLQALLGDEFRELEVYEGVLLRQERLAGRVQRMHKEAAAAGGVYRGQSAWCTQMNARRARG